MRAADNFVNGKAAVLGSIDALVPCPRFLFPARGNESISIMTLCDLCLTVPFSALPRLPQEHRSVTRVADHAENTHLFFMAGDEIASPTAELPDPIGFPFHKNLHALELSAKSCPLCRIAQIGARAWIDRLEDAAKNNKSFIEFHKGRNTVPTEERLWLTACDDGKQGFHLWVKSPNIAHGLYLLAAVRFCVESSLFRVFFHLIIHSSLLQLNESTDRL